MRIGVVCEGSNDFLALKEIFLSIARKKKVEIKEFECLQPKVDATSETQVGGGGWARVKVWLEDNSGQNLPKVLSPAIFSSSPSYDVLVIHLDGDVIDLCNSFSAAQRASCFQRSDLIVGAVEGFIEQILQPPDDLDDQIIYAVPVRHTEAWLIAASTNLPSKRNLEHGITKELAKRFLPRKHGGDLKAASRAAASLLGNHLDQIRPHLFSVDHFAKKVDAHI